MSPPLNRSELDRESFDAIAALAYKESGLQLVAEKSSMIQSRLRPRLHAVGISNFASYVELVRSDKGRAERKNMISALTTNVSHFFRENHHFEILTKEIFASAKRQMGSGGRFRIWSAGCSNGQEAFSALIALSEAFPDFENYDVKILGTDIDPKVVAFAKKAEYSDRYLTAVPENLLGKYFEQCRDSTEATYRVTEKLRSKVVFNELNLLGNWPMQNPFDVIFCRNVVIYFDQQTQNRLWPRFRDQLKENGHLFIGHSERIADPSKHGFSAEGPTTYRPAHTATKL